MAARFGTALLALGTIIAFTQPAGACSLCANVNQAPTFRQEAGQASAKLILYGVLANPRLGGNGTGTTEFHIQTIVRSDPFLGNQRVITLPRYLPVNDPKNPPRFLVFCDVFMNKLDPYRGVPIKDASAVDYLQRALALNPKDRTGNFLFFFPYLEHSDPEVSRDAFLEFAKANDREIGELAPKLSADKLAAWLRDPKTTPERLGLYAFLLGGCGGERDAAFLKSLLGETNDRVVNAYDGLLSGYIHLRPKDGWEVARATVRDGRKPLPVRLAVMRTLRFYQGWQPKETRPQALQVLAAVLTQGELADIAVENLRTWHMWDLTRDVLALKGKKGYDAPLMQRALVRYALCCDDPACRQYVSAHRRQDPELVKDVEESLELERRP